MPNFVRASKFRHVFGTGSRRDHCYEGMRVSKNSAEAPFCAVNPKYVAIILESAGGGSFVVLPLDKVGRVEPSAPKVSGHKQEVIDVAWCPFNDNIVASCSEDTTVKVWKIPEEGLVENLTKPLVTLERHQRRVNSIAWNPVANNILMSASQDNLVLIWNLETQQAVVEIDCHPDIIFSVCWNYNGSLLASTCKDKKIRIIDPRSGEVKQIGNGHEGAKPQRVTFCSNLGFLFTTGFSRMSRRQWAVYDQNDLSKHLAMDELDSSGGVNFPFYDPDTKMMYLASKGDSTIRYYELVSEHPYCHYLSTYQSSDPQKGCAFMPKRGCDVNHNEVARFYKIHSNKAICEPVAFTVPRKSELFQKDIFPDTAGDEPALTADEWISGKDSEPILISLEGGFKAKDKVESAIGTKNVMAGLSSKKIAEPAGKAEAPAADSPAVTSIAEELETLKKKVEQNEKEIEQLKQEVKELKEK